MRTVSLKTVTRKITAGEAVPERPVRRFNAWFAKIFGVDPKPMCDGALVTPPGDTSERILLRKFRRMATPRLGATGTLPSF